MTSETFAQSISYATAEEVGLLEHVHFDHNVL